MLPRLNIQHNFRPDIPTDLFAFSRTIFNDNWLIAVWGTLFALKSIFFRGLIRVCRAALSVDGQRRRRRDRSLEGQQETLEEDYDCICSHVKWKWWEFRVLATFFSEYFRKVDCVYFLSFSTLDKVSGRRQFWKMNLPIKRKPKKLPYVISNTQKT